MTNAAIARARLHNARLVGEPLARPEDVVAWFGAVQSQDVPGAQWALAQRMASDVTIGVVETAMDDGRIVRTHGPRPTWHFLAAEDLRWILDLVGPRVQQANSAIHRRRLGLEERDFERSEAVIRSLLADGRALTRPELARPIREAGIAFRDPNTIAYLVMHAELRAVICSGPRRGRQATYALVDQRIPPTAAKTREEALAELTTRYFRSHGPALAHDMAWWSGLTVTDVRRGIELVGPALEHRRVDGKDYWAAAGSFDPGPIPEPHVLLLSNYDEILGSYTDYSPVFDDALPKARTIADVLGAHIVVRNGLVVGGWRRVLGGDRATISVTRLVPFSPADEAALERQAEAFGRFLDLPVDLRSVDR
jgi:winged helix DNA-binding protein